MPLSPGRPREPVLVSDLTRGDPRKAGAPTFRRLAVPPVALSAQELVTQDGARRGPDRLTDQAVRDRALLPDRVHGIRASRGSARLVQGVDHRHEGTARMAPRRLTDPLASAAVRRAHDARRRGVFGVALLVLALAPIFAPLPALAVVALIVAAVAVARAAAGARAYSPARCARNARRASGSRAPARLTPACTGAYEGVEMALKLSGSPETRGPLPERDPKATPFRPKPAVAGIPFGWGGEPAGGSRV
jgi:hypothetical protein